MNFKKTEKILLGIIFSLILICHFNYVFASDAVINYEEKDYAIVSINSNVYQNFTSLSETQISIDNNNFPELKTHFENAIKKKTNSAIIEDVQLTLKQSENWINVSGSFKVMNISNKERDLLRINFTWKSFKIEDALAIKDLSFNKIGLYQFNNLIEKYSEVMNVEFYSPFYTPISFEKANQLLTNATMLDFEPLEDPLERWERSFNRSSLKTEFILEPRQRLYLRVEVVEENITKKYLILDSIGAKITVPYNAYVNDDLVTLEVSSGEREFYMLASIVVLAIAGISGLIISRKIG
ncbi:hypothetical protein AC481_02570 [miscellaneous Crenarchaeota group archaeon SMTZ-80]|nr:MAG: hypothetical protein AC481_02570 [miscellaneous Crenarchaeota group archaeon SMTZ-80]